MSDTERESSLIHTMPYELMRDICEILDAGDTWEQIAGYMPDVSMVDIEGCRRFGVHGSPSEYLLRIWASKGYSILSLYNLFALTKMVRCMRVMNSLINPKHYHLEEYALSSGNDVSKASRQVHNSASVKVQQGSATTPSGFKKIDAPSTSGSSITKPITALSTAGLSTVGSSDPLISALQHTLAVPFSELEVATNNFSPSNIIGKGGYGVVFVGEWKHTKIAVKRINASGDKGNELQRERLRQSLQELRTLAKYRHDNILPLYAFSLEGPDPCLVYQYMSNGSLEDRLLCKRGTAPLTWAQKREIAEGSARGLHFLHSIARTPIIHGDVKSANILLDRHFEPKLGDFGLSRDGQVEADAEEKSPLIASHIKGTLAYLPPEFITNRILSTKLDVYSFGIVLLEIATGLRAYVDSRTPHSLVDYCSQLSALIKRKEDGTISGIDHLIDKRTPRSENIESDEAWFVSVIQIGIQCAHKDRNQRPSFKNIVDLLNHSLPLNNFSIV